MVRRKTDGVVLTLDGLTTLQRWIVERQVNREDEISKTGKQWKRLGDMAELSSFFTVVDQLNDMADSTQEEIQRTPSGSTPMTKSEAISAALKQSSLEQNAPLDSSIEEALDALDEANDPSASGLQDLASELLEAFDGVANEEPEDSEGDDLADALLASLAVSGFYRVPNNLQEQLEEAHREALAVDKKEKEVRHSEPVVEVVQPSAPVEPDEPPIVTLKPKASPDVVVVSEPDPEPVPTPAVSTFGDTGNDWFGDGANDDDLYPAPKSNTAIFVVVGLVLVIGAIAFVVFGTAGDKSQAAASSASADGAQPTTPPPETTPPAPDTAMAAVPAETAPPAQADVVEEPPLDVSPDEIATDMRAGASYALIAQAAPAPASTAAAENPEEAKKKKKKPTFDSAMRDAAKARDRGKYREALDAYELALKLRKNNIEAIAGLGWSYYGLGSYDAAIREFERAISLSKRFAVAYIGLAKSYQKKGNDKKAYEMYNTYLELFPRGSQASIARAQSDRLKSKLGLDKPKEEPKKEEPKKEEDKTQTTTGDKKIITIKKKP